MAFFEHHGIEENEYFQVLKLYHSHFPLHFHRAYEIILVKQGEMLLTVDQQEFSVGEKEAAFIFPNQMHAITASPGADIEIVIFSPELIGHFFMNYKGMIPKNNLFSFPEVSGLAAVHSVYGQKAFLYHCCDKLVKETKFTEVKYSPKTKVIHQMLLFVDAHFQEECSLKAAAAELQYDYVYLSKLFLQMTNRTFTEYLNHYRISQACYQLKNTQKTVGEIAEASGYNNLRSFHRNFKRMMHCAPGDYRS
ncbi:helix-turn-helix transcriptional regulator [Alkalicoccus daliensis]|uniref:AraC-like ligand binding domain-containing protein n=1 Tax=Alkalicoccus daliensis TaxID=745820 RepID=A0A1H0E5T9_9BACI|nr:helix-turn-helix domain-containing protein [Alkalicoccus daliensis]SDN77784.1 AraC-like ligand binding domain-containing protein [Alkalicoccus daliensis]